MSEYGSPERGRSAVLFRLIVLLQRNDDLTYLSVGRHVFVGSRVLVEPQENPVNFRLKGPFVQPVEHKSSCSINRFAIRRNTQSAVAGEIKDFERGMEI